MINQSVSAYDIDPWGLPSVALDERDRLPQCAGIYFAIRGRALLYLGMSKNIWERWKDHHQLKPLERLQPGVRLHYLKLPLWSRDRLLRLESVLIAMYAPRLNQAGVTANLNGKAHLRPVNNLDVGQIVQSEISRRFARARRNTRIGGVLVVFLILVALANPERTRTIILGASDRIATQIEEWVLGD